MEMVSRFHFTIPLFNKHKQSQFHNNKMNYTIHNYLFLLSPCVCYCMVFMMLVLLFDLFLYGIDYDTHDLILAGIPGYFFLIWFWGLIAFTVVDFVNCDPVVFKQILVGGCNLISLTSASCTFFLLFGGDILISFM